MKLELQKIVNVDEYLAKNPSLLYNKINRASIAIVRIS